MAQDLSVGEFVKALKKVVTRGKQKEFLAIHAKAPGHAMTMRRLAEEVGYDGWRGMNLQYGKLAKQIAKAAGQPTQDINLLVKFIPPKGRDAKNISNSEWILVMDERFFNALTETGWI
jgi:hypothetical protein